MRPNEEQEQAAVVDWCDLHGIPVVHIPNEGRRSAYTGANLKRMGMRPGFPDLFIPVARMGYHGLFVEMKVGKNKPTRAQIEWLRRLDAEGYAVCVRYGADEAIGSIEFYMGGDNDRKKSASGSP